MNDRLSVEVVIDPQDLRALARWCFPDLHVHDGRVALLEERILAALRLRFARGDRSVVHRTETP